MGFEPTISCVTGRRALQAAPRGRILLSVAQVGFEPTASLRPTLRVGARAKVVCQLPTEPCQLVTQCPEQESNLQTPGFKPSRSSSWRTWARRGRFHSVAFRRSNQAPTTEKCSQIKPALPE